MTIQIHVHFTNGDEFVPVKLNGVGMGNEFQVTRRGQQAGPWRVPLPSLGKMDLFFCYYWVFRVNYRNIY